MQSGRLPVRAAVPLALGWLPPCTRFRVLAPTPLPLSAPGVLALRADEDVRAAAVARQRPGKDPRAWVLGVDDLLELLEQRARQAVENADAKGVARVRQLPCRPGWQRRSRHVHLLHLLLRMPAWPGGAITPWHCCGFDAGHAACPLLPCRPAAASGWWSASLATPMWASHPPSMRCLVPRRQRWRPHPARPSTSRCEGAGCLVARVAGCTAMGCWYGLHKQLGGEHQGPCCLAACTHVGRP